MAKPDSAVRCTIRLPSKWRVAVYALLALAFGAAILAVPNPACIEVMYGARWACTFSQASNHTTTQPAIDCTCGIYDKPFPPGTSTMNPVFEDDDGVVWVRYPPRTSGGFVWRGVHLIYSPGWYAPPSAAFLSVNTPDGAVNAQELGLDGMDILNAVRQAVYKPLAAPYPPGLLLAKENTWSTSGAPPDDNFSITYYRTDHAIRTLLALAALVCVVLFAHQLWKLIRVRHRIARHRCVFCAYQLGDSTLGVQCPECGRTYSPCTQALQS